MLRIEGTDIHLTRGDTAYIEVPIVKVMNGEQEDYPIDPTDELRFTMRRNQFEPPAVAKLLTGTNTFHFEPKDTKQLMFGSYIYDVELTTQYGDVYTVVENSKFFLEPEVTI